MENQKIHFKKIDFLRGLAILSVFLYHSQQAIFHYEVSDYTNSGLLHVTDRATLFLNFAPTAFGWSGVSLFLLISGFLIHFGFLSKSSQFNSADFFGRRFWRIYPPYLVVLLFFCFSRDNVLYHSLLTGAGLKDLFYHLFLLHNVNDQTYFSINPSFWSLALEAQLYLVYPILLYARKRVGITKVFGITLILSFLLLSVELIVPGLSKKLSFDSSVFKLWYIWAAGAFLAEKVYQKERIFSAHLIPMMVICFVLTILSKAFLVSSYFTVYLATFFWLIFFEWFLFNEKIAVAGKYFKAMSLIGLCSYSIYLIHQPYLFNIYQFFNAVSVKHWEMLWLPLKVVGVFVIIFLISYSLYLFIELPSIKLGAALRNRKAGKQALEIGAELNITAN